MSPGAQNMKTGLDALGIAKNMKTGPDTLSTAVYESGRVKLENGTRRPQKRRKQVRERKIRKRDPTPSVSPKTSSGVQNMKTGPETLGICENESTRAKYENGT
jgi:hypothetical protein